MSIAQAIAPHLPYLRRFARALTGTQQGGDAYAIGVREMASRLAADLPQKAQGLRVLLNRSAKD